MGKKQRVSQREVLRVLRELMGEHGLFVTFIFFVYVVAFSMEGIGFSLLIPLLQAVIAPDSETEGSGAFIRFLLEVKNLFPEDNRLLGLVGLLTGLFFLKSLVMLFSVGATRWFIDTLRMEWMARAFRNHLLAPFEDMTKQPVGVVVENTVHQTHDAAKGIFLVVDLLARVVQIVVLVAFLLLTNWQVTLLILFVGSFLFALTWRKSQDYSHASGKKRQLIRQRSCDVVSETVSGLRSIKLLNLHAPRIDLLKKLQRKHRYIDTSFETFSAIPNSLLDFIAILVGGSAIYFLLEVAKIPAEEVIPMTALIGVLFMRLAGAASYLFSRRVKIIMAYPSIKLVYDMLKIPTEKMQEGEEFIAFTQDVEFRHVIVQPEGRNVVHDNVSFSLPHKGLTGIVGPSGSGKTTLVDLLVGLRKPTSGQILINGRDLGNYDLSSLRTKVGYLAQTPQLFNLSVAQNLRLASPDASDAELVQVCKKAHAHEFIKQMPKGYETELGSEAASLSGGQRQRLALARELLKKPELFIFDEPTSALDVDGQAIIRDLIGELAKEKPVIVITHNPQIVENAAQILYLKDGQLKVEGPKK